MTDFKYRHAKYSDIRNIKKLLSANNLPSEEIKDHLPDFILAEKNGQLAGTAGVELIKDTGLLRSLAVTDPEQGKGLGSIMVDKIISYAKFNNVKRLFLFTTTAEQFFARKGFKKIARDILPEGIQNTKEFKVLCPANAVCMMRQIAEEEQTKMLLGAHMSVSGGIENSILRGKEVGCDVIQLFTRNNNRWKSRPLAKKNIADFKKAAEQNGVIPFASHDAYLINLAAPDPAIYEKSIKSFLDEMDRAEALGIPYLIFHPGSHLGRGEDKGIRQIAGSLKHLLAARPDYCLTLLLETTAGQGSALGYSFEHLSEIMQKTGSDRIGVCLDTCHVFAAGYNLADKAGYKKTFKEFDKIIGLNQLKAFHLNDSKKGLGSRVDRHQHIGKGEIGLAAFRFLMNDERFENIPMALETPKGPAMEDDRENLKILRSLIIKKR